MKQKMILCCCLLSASIFSQKIDLSISSIPINLSQQANAVVRHNETVISIEEIDKMVLYKKQIITVLNENGEHTVSRNFYYNNDTKITKLKAIVYDKFGNQLKKYSKGKFDDYSAVSENTMYSDSRVKTISHTPKNYPYTILFESEIKTKTTCFIPSWSPINGYGISVEKCIYRIENPKGLTIRTKEINFENYLIKNISSRNTIAYTLTNSEAITREDYSPSFRSLVPSLMVGLREFALKGFFANVNNWSEFGHWMRSSLYEDRTNLNPLTIKKINEFVKKANTPLEKAKLVYEYVQNKTRYINVSIGISGWQPSLAKDVDELGYGDCKGLTNYTKALLDAVGVESNWTIVYANKKRDITKKFTSMQGNHMILNIPNGDQDVWLECTNQKLPFGFLGNFTDDRDVLVLGPKGGVIKHTPVYKNEANSQQMEGDVVIDSLGNVNAKITLSSQGLKYDKHYFLEDYDKKQLEKYYNSHFWFYLNNFELLSSGFNNDKNSVIFQEKLKVGINKYATLSEENMIFRINIFNKYSSVPKRYRNRKLAFEIQNGFLEKDHFVFSIPSGYSVRRLPNTYFLKSDFGTYKVVLKKIDNTHIEYRRVFTLNAGIYPKENYDAYRNFLKSIAKYDNTRIVLHKLKTVSL